MSELAGTLMGRLDGEFTAARDPVRAVGMAAYMRDQFPFLGLPSPIRRARARAALTGLGAPTSDDLRAVALACWDRDEREFQQFACDYLAAHVAEPSLLDTAASLITTKSWWDTVDPLATHFVAGLVRRHPVLVAEMDEWSRAPDLWLVRTAILHQLHYGASTDTARLFGYCTAQAGHPDFFVRKAIGWALRHYARTDPGAVRAFVSANSDRLSPLSIREATKHL
ncbi:3-methyladenine DNA glycosylase AlkD [Actinoplanes lutulentus]|uniref:3-methyladenine DNA glycosylase AlkD n=1 Tax=Actinoplanes lutulentus TaxID=1287878 RepID=A0A327ZCD3_9ACTN|nr:DNA alkylation repair protein [Actinoplanes lutulentus]MBB2941481.1 3-methyladenine DNA glycosylase AlkD [Actinoplanes lutulentus]RAK36971.1 3-methyladenine DNA glycosylase AlkD [Actinoplanes lutulentus]